MLSAPPISLLNKLVKQLPHICQSTLDALDDIKRYIPNAEIKQIG